MSRRFLAAVVCLSASVGLLLGLVIAGSMTPTPAVSAETPRLVPARKANATLPPAILSSFADVAERLNPAVVNIDATSRGGTRPHRRLGPQLPDRQDSFESPFERERDRDEMRRGTGTGFIIDADGYILTNQHVVELAEKLTVRLTDGRHLRARIIGADTETDIALLKVDAQQPLPFAAVGNSDRLRVGEWVVAIGNPLAYEHTVTVGVVSFIGRKLFDTSLDRYIQTDAAINFGNSGGPLINVQGEVVGINAAISSRAPNIGFAVPINQATAILPQLVEKGRVSRGYLGVGPRDVDPDLQRSLGLKTANGVLVQDVTAGSPGARAGIRTYDLIVAVDGKAISGSDQLIQLIASRRPGSMATLQVLRDNRPLTLPVKLAERPASNSDLQSPDSDGQLAPSGRRGPVLGLSVRELDRDFATRARLPDGLEGIIVSGVEPMSPAFDAEIERGQVLLEINRQPVRSVQDYQRLVGQARPGDVLAFYLYQPQSLRRTLQTIKID
jgi:serine protease Do